MGKTIHLRILVSNGRLKFMDLFSIAKAAESRLDKNSNGSSTQRNLPQDGSDQ